MNLHADGAAGCLFWQRLPGNLEHADGAVVACSGSACPATWSILTGLLLPFWQCLLGNLEQPDPD